MLLPRSRYDEGVELVKSMIASVVPGDPLADDTLCGPVISANQRDRVVGYIRKGMDEGANLVVGGPDAPEGLDTGYYVKPSLFVDVDNSMTIAREEIFGPVLVVIPYEDDDDAVRIANDSPYGLAGFVLSNDLDRSMAVGRRLRAGTIGLNGGAAIGADVPFGGYKDSGVGRQNGTAGFDQYLEMKSLAWPAG
jgi:acyl-CoA reductase-like NAD-dependent aldehyde dehydrogenase